MKTQTLYLIRGIPGSGKSTKARELIESGCADEHYEADQFFIYSGVYKFRAEDIKSAHFQCQYNTEKALKEGKSVVVANTFIKLWEMQPYIIMAGIYNVKIEVIKCNGRFPNIHNVSESVIERMLSSFEEYL